MLRGERNLEQIIYRTNQSKARDLHTGVCVSRPSGSLSKVNGVFVQGAASMGIVKGNGSGYGQW